MNRETVHQAEVIGERIGQYVNMVNRLNQLHYHMMSFKQGYHAATVEFGKRYAKILVGRSVHTFIDLTTGDILKAASYKAPAKNGVRGNIWDTDCGESVVNHYGAKYLK